MARRCETIAIGFVLAFVALHVVLGLVAPTPTLWGFDILRFCPAWQVVVFLGLAAGSLALGHPAAMAWAEAVLARLGRRLAALPVRPGPLKTHLALFLASAILLFLLGTKYSGGDARWMSGSMPVFLKRSPLASAVLVAGVRLGGLLGVPYLPSLQASITVVGALCVCGLYQLFLLLFADKSRAAMFLAASLASYGISRLLPGYIEVYIGYLLFLIVYECALVHYCLAERGLAWLLGALFLLLLAHIQALVVVPGTLGVGAATCWRRGRMRVFLALCGLFVVALVVAYPLLEHRGESYNVLGEVARLVGPGETESRFWSTQGGRRLVTPLSVLLSARHWAGMASVHALVSGIGLGLLAPGLVLWGRERRRDGLVAVSALNYGLFVVGTVLYYNYMQPLERDWDMFGAGALYLLVLAGALWRLLPREKLRRAFLVVFCVTAGLTILWLGQQAGRWGIAPPPDVRVSFAAPD